VVRQPAIPSPGKPFGHGSLHAMASPEAEKKQGNVWHRFLDSVPHKGHKDLLIRGLCSGCHAVFSFILAFGEDAHSVSNTPHTLVDACLFLVMSLTLIEQFRSANPYMMIVRGLANFGRVVVVVHGAACGGAPAGDECDDDGWSDIRKPFRVIACINAFRLFLIGVSLLIQFALPLRGVGQHGNKQLFWRAILQGLGLPIHYVLAMSKIGELSNTQHVRPTTELVFQFIRAFSLTPLTTWALMNQWATAGVGQVTDDWRTSGKGEAHPNATDAMSKKVAAHKGHRNLLIRSCMSFAQATATAWLIGFDITRPAQMYYIISQLIGSASLFVQFRTGNPKMFLVRASSNWFACIIAIYATKCGSNDNILIPDEKCGDAAWQDDRISLRIVAVCASCRLFFNGLSLICQFKFPHKMFGGHGNLQLFCRGAVQATGVPIHLTRFILKNTVSVGQSWEAVALDYTVNMLRGCLFIPISSWSLFHQWYHTSAGNTGHPVSDMFERDADPDIVDFVERVRVTIISSKGLRKADITGKSDPYCIVNVLGRPESTFQTKVCPKTLEPVWNESQELVFYKHHDLIELVVRDHDEAAKVPCCRCFDDGDDLLGKCTLTSAQVHQEGGFAGEVPLTHAGKKHKHAVINIKIEVLGIVDPEAPSLLGKAEDAATDAAEAVKDVEGAASSAVELVVEGAEEAVKDIKGEVANAAAAAENEISKDLNALGIKS